MRDIGVELNNQPKGEWDGDEGAPSMDLYDCEVRLLKAPLQRLACRNPIVVEREHIRYAEVRAIREANSPICCSSSILHW